MKTIQNKTSHNNKKEKKKIFRQRLPIIFVINRIIVGRNGAFANRYVIAIVAVAVQTICVA